ncbi:zinc-ribbon domain-containing protein [Virgibacillus halophilus]|uniref:Zinc-ribbon domain-containing protein n=1 Tax=Tigheibacillus halophilus TaxID=361280 RepID=A0ABU5C8R9_9BACI|nr:zinc-ribbon domain-containing protein [Virgibacillus halophilus]
MYCKHCGHKVKEGARFCKECGHQLKAEYEHATQQTDNGENKDALQENAATVNPVPPRTI